MWIKMHKNLGYFKHQADLLQNCKIGRYEGHQQNSMPTAIFAKDYLVIPLTHVVNSSFRPTSGIFPINLK